MSFVAIIFLIGWFIWLAGPDERARERARQYRRDLQDDPRDPPRGMAMRAHDPHERPMGLEKLPGLSPAGVLEYAEVFFDFLGTLQEIGIIDHDRRKELLVLALEEIEEYAERRTQESCKNE
jgi:hypothetical protein